MSRIVFLATFLPLCCLVPTAQAQQSGLDTERGDRMLAAYFRHEVDKLRDACLADVNSLEDWKSKQPTYRQQLREMLGLEPWPEKTDLRPTITATTEHDAFRVERLHFQSRPGLYVTGNLYVPNEFSEPLPAILYVCGHGRSAKNGVSFGNKVSYQHHGSWFARNGYVCLTIDTLQLGEIEGIHHGTYREKMWWWLNRGYTPAGVEAWNCVRAIDYLQSREEVDPDRIGVTGRSGGGAYSWWVAAVDERIQCAVPVAGITDLENHVVDGCVEGHCDCMYMVNTFRWDYPLVAALVAPRPLLISNTDSDGIFPLDGVYRTFEKVRGIYELYGAADKVALNITAGTHKDTQELRVHAFRWLNEHLRGDDALIDEPAVKYFEPEELKVFTELPADQVNTSVHETFVAAADSTVPANHEQWCRLRDSWWSALTERVFAGWPDVAGPLSMSLVTEAEREGLLLRVYDFTSQRHVRLRLYTLQAIGITKPAVADLHILDDEAWHRLLATLRPAFEAELREPNVPDPHAAGFQVLRNQLLSSSQVMAWVAPRGIGPTAWDQSERKQTQHRRRFYLLGQSLDGMRIYDVRRAIQALRTQDAMGNVPLQLRAHGSLAGVAVYASLFEPGISQLDLHDLPKSHRDGPILLNVRRFLDLPQAVAMVAEHSQVVIHQSSRDGWEYPLDVARRLGWDENSVRIVASATADES